MLLAPIEKRVRHRYDRQSRDGRQSGLADQLPQSASKCSWLGETELRRCSRVFRIHFRSAEVVNEVWVAIGIALSSDKSILERWSIRSFRPPPQTQLTCLFRRRFAAVYDHFKKRRQVLLVVPPTRDRMRVDGLSYLSQAGSPDRPFRFVETEAVGGPLDANPSKDLL